MIIVFDVDGVLCESRQRPSDEMRRMFNELASHHNVYLCTGTGYDEIVEQVAGLNYKGLFSDSGALYNGKPHEFTPKGIPEINNDAGYPFKIVKRPYGLYLNFAHRLTREEFIERDKKHFIRLEVQRILKELYPMYQFLIGGQVSIDVLTIGKEAAIKQLRKTYPQERIMFIGDRCQNGGNDYQAFSLADIGVQVKSPDDTLRLMQLLLGSKH